MEDTAQKRPFIITGADGQPIIISHGDFYFNTKARCKRMAQNSLSADARRVYAVLELGTLGFQQEEAVMMDRGEKRNMTPDDIVQQSGLPRQKVRKGLEELEEARLAERFSDDGGPLRRHHVHIRSWAVPRPPKEDVCSRARLQTIPDWWPEADPDVPRWTDSWAPLRSLAKRLKINISSQEESARDYKTEGDEVARAYQEAEIAAARFLERVGAPTRINNVERTERTSQRTAAAVASIEEASVPVNGTPPPVLEEPKPEVVRAPDPVLQKLQEHGGDPEAARRLTAECRKAAPDVKDAEIPQLIDHWITKEKPRHPVGFLLKHLPGKLAHGGLAAWRKIQANNSPESRLWMRPQPEPEISPH